LTLLKSVCPFLISSLYWYHLLVADRWMAFCLQYYLFHGLAGGLFHFKKVSLQVMSCSFSAVSIGSIERLYYSSLLLLRRWKEHILPRKPLATSGAKALQSAAPFATGYRCDGAVQSSGPSPNKNGILPAYTLPARRTCSGSAANVLRPRGRRGRAAAAAANIDQLIQAYTA
jgi:hypothetical protein